jgi:hypothetical protein
LICGRNLILFVIIIIEGKRMTSAIYLNEDKQIIDVRFGGNIKPGGIVVSPGLARWISDNLFYEVFKYRWVIKDKKVLDVENNNLYDYLSDAKDDLEEVDNEIQVYTKPFDQERYDKSVKIIIEEFERIKL